MTHKNTSVMKKRTLPMAMAIAFGLSACGGEQWGDTNDGLANTGTGVIGDGAATSLLLIGGLLGAGAILSDNDGDAGVVVTTAGNDATSGQSGATDGSGIGDTEGSGTTDSSGNTDGSGSNNGTGNTDGSGNSDGSGSTDGSGSNDGTGDTGDSGTDNGSGSTDNAGTDNSSGSTDGSGTDNGSGNTSGSGTDNGSGNTSGSDTNDGSGNTDNSGTEDGSDNSDGSGNGDDSATLGIPKDDPNSTLVSSLEAPDWLLGMWNGTDSANIRQVGFISPTEVGVSPAGSPLTSYSDIPDVCFHLLENTASTFEYTVWYPGPNGTEVVFNEKWVNNGDGSALYTVSGAMEDEYIMYSSSASNFLAPPLWLQGRWASESVNGSAIKIADINEGNIILGDQGANRANYYQVAGQEHTIFRIIENNSNTYAFEMTLVNTDHSTDQVIAETYTKTGTNTITWSSTGSSSVAMTRQ